MQNSYENVALFSNNCITLETKLVESAFVLVRIVTDSENDNNMEISKKNFFEKKNQGYLPFLKDLIVAA
jgi:hypothetical protein